MTRRRTTSSVPLYATEDEIARAVMGDRAADWPAKARFLEDKFNLPRIRPLMGGRYWPAVKRFFDLFEGLDAEPTIVPTMHSRIQLIPFPPDGKENHDAEKTAAAGHRGPDRRPRRARA